MTPFQQYFRYIVAAAFIGRETGDEYPGYTFYSYCEKFHMKFIKEILGVHCKASNVACRAELGRLPLWAKISFSCIKFLEHLLTSENTLVFKNFQATKNFNPWAKKLYSIFNSLGFSYIAESNCSIKALLPNIKQRLIDQCTQEQSSKIYSSTKLKFYQHFYDFNCRSAYVDILRNKTERSILCKIRLSAHNLAIERGRHLGLHTSDRICTICKTGDVEDESHFLFKCEKYSNYRRSFQCNILSILQKNHLSENQMLKFCMNSNSLKVLRVTCSYINNCLTLRNEIIQYS
ncbi:MAG: hypothetical protein H0A76_13340 [Candidatus Thiodubiliella endoseptemdiera]|uniref:Reverse transcriptase zinc-binding domain-containing protein n=1 Tax=Candidatus Thiodubiliella endoseptemdiera TaxID=2738886 RepID=A0A853F5T3_9GAMM|nr:hypothetical protein [Candidatus Thiodubiliella endoseptemdiera]